jgi:hypothetical protein
LAVIAQQRHGNRGCAIALADGDEDVIGARPGGWGIEADDEFALVVGDRDIARFPHLQIAQVERLIDQHGDDSPLVILQRQRRETTGVAGSDALVDP